MSFSGSYYTVFPSVSSLGHIVGHVGCITSVLGTLALYQIVITHRHSLRSSTSPSCREWCQTRVAQKPACYRSIGRTYKYYNKLISLLGEYPAYLFINQINFSLFGVCLFLFIFECLGKITSQWSSKVLHSYQHRQRI